MCNLFCGMLVFGLVSVAEAESNIQKFRDNFDGGKETCTSLGGTEIKNIRFIRLEKIAFTRTSKSRKFLDMPQKHMDAILSESKPLDFRLFFIITKFMVRMQY